MAAEGLNTTICGQQEGFLVTFCSIYSFNRILSGYLAYQETSQHKVPCKRADLTKFTAKFTFFTWQLSFFFSTTSLSFLVFGNTWKCSEPCNQTALVNSLGFQPSALCEIKRQDVKDPSQRRPVSLITASVLHLTFYIYQIAKPRPLLL